MNTQTNKKGFTIIEVVLVLAIAALIFLMIFVALPALQRGQRDTARKNDASSISAAINTFRSNHRGSLVGMDAADLDENISQLTITDVSTDGVGGDPAGEDDAVVSIGAECDENGEKAVDSSSSRKAAVVINLENSDTTFCTEG